MGRGAVGFIHPFIHSTGQLKENLIKKTVSGERDECRPRTRQRKHFKSFLQKAFFTYKISSSDIKQIGSQMNTFDHVQCAWYLHGNSGLVTHVWSDFDYLIYIRHLFRLTAVTNLIFFPGETRYSSHVSTVS